MTTLAAVDGVKVTRCTARGAAGLELGNSQCSWTHLSAVKPLQSWVVNERLDTAMLELGAHGLIHVAACGHEYRSCQNEKQKAQLCHL